jgi:hydroxymethylpyrimidine/phosphomethylpyrimidine kinase
MIPALSSITDHTVAGTGPQVGSGSLADIASVAARYILANVTLLVLNHNRVSLAREYYNKPVPKIKLRPNFSVFIIESVKTCCIGSTKSTISVEICTTEYDIHHGSFLKLLPP